VRQIYNQFEATLAAPSVKGFAVGRTIFADAARAWMAAVLPALLPMLYGQAFAGAVPAATILVLAAGIGSTASVGSSVVMAAKYPCSALGASPLLGKQPL